MLARETPAVDALTPPVAVAEVPLTSPVGGVFDAVCPPAPPVGTPPAPVVLGALTLVPELGALPVVGALVLVLGTDCCCVVGALPVVGALVLVLGADCC